MKALITGAGGQVGRALVRNAPAGMTIKALSHAELDISSQKDVVSYVLRCRPDVIVNAAAHTAVDRAESEPALARAINADGPRHLALAAREVRSRLIHISTDFVFDGTSAIPYRPETPTNPVSVYGITKRAGERAVLEVLPERSTIVRTAWVYAAHGHNFVNTLLRVMKEKGSARVVADQIGTPTAATSLAETIWMLVARPDIDGIHHWTDAGVASWYDFAVAIAEEASVAGLLSQGITVTPIATHDYPTPARRPSYSVLDSSSLQSLGIVPVHWRERLRSVLAELRNG
jgi:dTDP-4-dehydrorhamnose reductase